MDNARLKHFYLHTHENLHGLEFLHELQHQKLVQERKKQHFIKFRSFSLKDIIKKVKKIENPLLKEIFFNPKCTKNSFHSITVQ